MIVCSSLCAAAIRRDPADYKRQDQPLLLYSQRPLFSALRRVHSQVVGDGSVPQPPQNPNPELLVCDRSVPQRWTRKNAQCRAALRLVLKVAISFPACDARMPQHAIHTRRFFGGGRAVFLRFRCLRSENE